MDTPQKMKLTRQLWGEFWAGITFLTTIPAPKFDFPDGGLGLAGRWFTLIGLSIGFLLMGVQGVAQAFFPPLLTSALVVLAWVALTGGLHLDGVADCCDGLLSTTSRARRLEILRDPRVGSFGAIGLVLVLLLKVVALATIIEAGATGALVLAPVWGRWLLLWAARQPQARPEGMGAAFSAGVTPEVLIYAAPLPLYLLTWSNGSLLNGGGVAGACLAVLTTMGIVLLARKRLGGVTGDVYGAVVEVSELAMLLALAAQPNWG